MGEQGNVTHVSLRIPWHEGASSPSEKVALWGRPTSAERGSSVSRNPGGSATLFFSHLPSGLDGPCKHCCCCCCCRSFLSLPRVIPTPVTNRCKAIEREEGRTKMWHSRRSLFY